MLEEIASLITKLELDEKVRFDMESSIYGIYIYGFLKIP